MPCSQSLGGPIGLDEELRLSSEAGGSSGTGGATARSLLQSVIARENHTFTMRWFVPPDCRCPYARPPLTLSLAGDPSNATIEPKELSCGKRLRIEGISLHLKTEDGAFDEVVPGTIEGELSRAGKDAPLVYEAQFSGVLSPTLHGSYDVSPVTKQFAEPKIELQYDLRFSGSGTIVVRDASDTIHVTPIASWYDVGVLSPTGTGDGCQGQGGGGPVNQYHAAGFAGLCL